MDAENNMTYLGYIRVSKSDMCLDRQWDSLIAANVPERNIYQEKVTGTKRDREELNKMLESIKPNGKCFKRRRSMQTSISMLS